MNSDFAFTIGKSHEVCQDYAFSYSSDSLQAIIVCDGCSSSCMSDVGARLTALTAMKVLQGGVDKVDILSLIADRLNLYRLDGLVYDETMLDTTLLIAYVDSRCPENIQVVMRGDGVVALRRNDGLIRAFSVEYPSGYPHYLSYELFPNRKKSFEELDEGMVIRRYDIYEDGYDEFETEHHETSQTQRFLYGVGGYKSISLFSDGVHSFKTSVQTDTSKTWSGCHPTIPLRELLNIKSSNGRFIQRRLNKFKKWCDGNNLEHLDDLSMATIYFGEEGE